MKRNLIIAFFVIFAIIVGVFLLKYYVNANSSELTFHGNVDVRQISLAFNGSGRISELRVEEGDFVKAGQVVGLLDTKALTFQADQAKAQAEAQRQTLLKFHNGSRPEEIIQAQSQFKSAEAESLRAQKSYDRAIDLQKSANGSISSKEVDLARANLDSAKGKADSLAATLKLTEIGPRAEEIASAEAQFKATQAQVSLLEHQINQATLIAPVDSIVRSRLHEPGDMVTSAAPVFSLVVNTPKWIRIYVGEPDLGKIKPGMEAQVFTDSYPNRPVLGKVGYISSVAEFTPKAVQTKELRTSLVYEARIVVDDHDNVLRLGQPTTVCLSTQTTS